MIYLDNSATTRQYDEVTELIAKVSREEFGNPSSLHSLGLDAEKLIKRSRKTLIDRTSLKNLIFTSGGTEADNMAVFSVARKYRRANKKYITTQIEHPAVLEAMERLEMDGNNVAYIPVDSEGIVNIEALKNEIDEDTAFVSVMTVNNETGAIQPINEISEIIKEKSPNALFHTDAVQAFGKMELKNLSADMISISGHKFHGPKGIGALYVNDKFNILPYIVGGGQESGLRSGTENVPAICGVSLAADMSYANFDKKMEKLTSLNEYLYEGLMSELTDIRLNGPRNRLPSILNVSFLGTRAEVLIHTVEQDGIYVSTGSACSSNKNGDSNALSAMGLNHEEIEGAIRFSFSEFNSISEMDIVIDKFAKAVKRFRKLGSFR